MKDRFYIGFFAGFLGALVPFVINFVSRALGLNILLWADFIFLGLLGAIFALILPFITSKYHLFKGALYGIATWFFLLFLPHLLKAPKVTEIPLMTAVIHAICASFWGMSMAFILKWLDKKLFQQKSGRDKFQKGS